MSEIRAELRTLREVHERLLRRLEKVEAIQAVQSSRSAPPRATAENVERPLEVPDLTVVKLKPRTAPAPKLNLSIPVQEPSPAVVETLVRAPPEEPALVDPAVLDAQFEQALEALRTGNLDGGVLKMQQFAAENPLHPKADNALYFSGVGQLGLSDNEGAARTFEQVVSTYPAGDAVVDSLLKLAECKVRLNQPKDARVLYGQVITRYPGTAAASQAEARLAGLAP